MSAAFVRSLLRTLLLVALTLPSVASAELFLQVESNSQGWIQGDVTRPGHEDWIELYAFSHGISTPTGPNGLPTGSPVTMPVNITKQFDRATVQLFQAVSNLEGFANFRIDFMRPNQQGQSILYFRIDLDDALLVSLQQAGDASAEPTEAATFNYSRITLTDVINGTITQYDWNTGATVAPGTLAKGILAPPTPNPSRDGTRFEFALPVASSAELSLFDVRGRLVKELHRGWTSVDPVVALWDGKDESGATVAQGLYLARLTYPGTVVTQRVMIVR